ncbi:alpha/beta hydrolase family protein [Aliikangiella maris]|uniref:Alpha/beta fold hydrolase n=2 Tax=Aliikangiella maris TaxID=3162458 RepID=A0ABV3MJ08_9GAMM
MTFNLSGYHIAFKDRVIGSTKVVSHFGQYDVNDVIYNENTSQFLGVTGHGDFIEYKYYHKKLAQAYADLQYSFPQSEINITSYTRDYNKMVVNVSSIHNQDEFYFYDAKKFEIQKIAEAFPKVSEIIKSIAIQKIEYKAQDGTLIDSYFTTPAIAKGKEKPPLIVLPHGGPRSRDTIAFDWMRQFYLVNGYAVFQPNFRGSTGRGKEFRDAGDGEWGRLMQQDVDDGVDELIKQGLVDANRICVVGASYGGYVALYAATTNYKRYRCAVSVAGVSDLDDLFYHAKEQKQFVEYWEDSLGKRTEQSTLKAYSPLFLVTENTAPILLLHGTEDTVVPIFQSTNMYKALKKVLPEQSELIKLEGEDHWFSLGKSRKVFLQESLAFIQKHI